MTTITFDTHKFIRTLKDAGVSEVQAESDLATKRDIVDLRRDIDVRFERVDGELKLNRWMLGVFIGWRYFAGFKSVFLSLKIKIKIIPSIHNIAQGKRGGCLSRFLFRLFPRPF